MNELETGSEAGKEGRERGRGGRIKKKKKEGRK